MVAVQPLPIAVLRLWRTTAIASGAMAVLALAVVEVGLGFAIDLPPLLWLVPPAAGTVVAATSWLVADVRYRAWRFELTDEWIQARWGVVTHHTATIPRNRVQTMTSENGPVDRFLGLTSVTVHTAGAGAPNLAIPHLDDPTVEWLRGELARGSRP
jgi:hypothetical protein